MLKTYRVPLLALLLGLIRTAALQIYLLPQMSSLTFFFLARDSAFAACCLSHGEHWGTMQIPLVAQQLGLALPYLLGSVSMCLHHQYPKRIRRMQEGILAMPKGRKVHVCVSTWWVWAGSTHCNVQCVPVDKYWIKLLILATCDVFVKILEVHLGRRSIFAITGGGGLFWQCRSASHKMRPRTFFLCFFFFTMTGGGNVRWSSCLLLKGISKPI